MIAVPHRNAPLRHCNAFAPLCAAAALLLLACGCYQGSLATRVGPSQHDWSIAKQQNIHRGEAAEFQFVVINKLNNQPIGNAADYVVWEFGGVPEVTTIEADGKFRTRLKAVDTEEMPEQITVYATAYRARGHQDKNVISGELVSLGNPNDLRDERVASDSINVRLYQALVRFDIDEQTGPYKWDTAMLTLQTPNGPMIIRRSRLDRTGFELIDDPDGKRTVLTYEPKATEIQTTGTTRAVLLVQDVNGREKRFEQIIDTP